MRMLLHPLDRAIRHSMHADTKNGHQIAYRSQNRNGELFVAAPKGSNEAQLFDGLAAMITGGPVSHLPMRFTRP